MQRPFMCGVPMLKPNGLLAFGLRVWFFMNSWLAGIQKPQMFSRWKRNWFKPAGAEADCFVPLFCWCSSVLSSFYENRRYCCLIQRVVLWICWSACLCAQQYSAFNPVKIIFSYLSRRSLQIRILVYGLSRGFSTCSITLTAFACSRLPSIKTRQEGETKDEIK